MSQVAAIENVIGKVYGEVRQEVTALLEEGLKEAQRILDTAEGEALGEYRKTLDDARRQAETNRRKIVGGMELRARNMSLQLLEETVERVFEASVTRLKGENERKRCEKALRRLLEEAVSAVESTEVVASANSRELRILERIARKVGKEKAVKITVETDPIECSGGVRVRTPDGTIIYDNTIEARLARFKPFLRKTVTDILLKGR